MRYIISIALLFLLGMVTSCEKKCNDPVNGDPKSLIGSWELRSSGGGFSGQTTNYPAGNGTRYVFSATAYKYYHQGSLVKTGQYKIVKNTSYLYGDVRDMIVFDNEATIQTIVTVKDYQLDLEMDANDGGGSRWVRQ